jgi:hypothetical protein
MTRRFVEEVTRTLNFSDVKAWHCGQSEELKKLMGIRTSTEALSYELAKKSKLGEQPRDFILFKGELYIKNDT